MPGTQDGFGRIGFFEDFQGLTDDDDITISDAAPLRWKDVCIVPISGNVAQNVTVDESGGVISFSGAGSAADGVALLSAPMQPSGNGTIRMGVRFKTSNVTTLQMFVGWQETADRDETVIPFTLSGTTLTANNVGQVYGLYFDTTATTDDWRAAGASDGTIFTASGTLGVLAATGIPVNDEYMTFRVEIDTGGVARAYLGDSSVDAAGTGFKLVDTLVTGNLDATALYHPVVHMIDPSTNDPTWEVDYFWAKGNRDWTF